MSLIAGDIIRFDEYAIDRARWLLSWRGEPIALNRKTFDLLLYLADRAPRVVSREELLKSLWPESFVEESNLNQHVFLLRKALTRHASGEKIIVTVPGRGYCFGCKILAGELGGGERGLAVVPTATVGTVTASVTRASVTRVTVHEDVEETEEEAGMLALGAPVARRGGRQRGFAVAALLLVMAGCGGWFGWRWWEDRQSGPPVQVVLAELEGGTGDARLDRALVDAMRVDLGQSPFVSVVSTAMMRRTLVEMTYKPEEAVSGTVARDLCERTGSQAILRGSVAKIGDRYLLTEEATSCVDGSTLAGTRQEARSREDLPRAVERLAERVRLRLGESRRTIAHFSTPLLATRTGSLEALEDFSQAVRMSDRGEMPQAIELLKQAIVLDPKFTAAYANLAIFYGAIGDSADDRATIARAYELRDTATEPVRRSIVAHYHSAVTGDLYESERNLRAWANLYPRSVAPWVGLGDVERQLGHHADAVTAYEHAMELSPRFLAVYYGLAMEQMHAGQADKARATSELALARGLDGDLIRMNLFRIAYLTHDQALLQAQVTWGESHPDSPFLLAYESAMAQDEGQLGHARSLLHTMAEELRHEGVASAANRYFQDAAGAFAELGDIADARQVLHIAPVDPNEYEQVRALAEVGETASAGAMLKDQLTKHPQSTAWSRIYGPWLRAELALAAHRPQEAIADLESTRAFDGVGYDGTYLRGKAFLEEGQPARAEAEFREVIAHPETDPLAYQLPMAWLELARAQRQEGHTAEAAETYRHFMSGWSGADRDAPLLLVAQREAGSLPKDTPVQRASR
jgi:DNA-binding winged helix-turn-helix (wHTH) protein/tetratricopeptide (TPR) repeat protein